MKRKPKVMVELTALGIKLIESSKCNNMYVVNGRV